MKSKQPVVQLPYSTFERIADAISVFLILTGWLLVLSKFSTLPEQIPSHFNAEGQVDGHGSKGVLFILPALSAILTIGIIILSRYPQSFNFPYRITEENAPFEYRKARILLRVVSVFTNLLLLLLTWDILQAVNGHPGLGVLFWIVFIILLIAPATIMLAWKPKAP